MKKIIHIILKKKLYKFTKNKYGSTLEQSIKDSKNLSELKVIFIDYLSWFIDNRLSETINFITKNKNLLKYLNIYINQNNPTGNILIINNTEELIINTTKKCFIINSQNVDVLKADDLTIVYSQYINVNYSNCKIIKHSSNITLTKCKILHIKNSELIHALQCTLSFISNTDLMAEFCEEGKCHHNTNIKAICCKNIILFDTSSAQVFGNTNIECCGQSYCNVNDEAVVIFNEYSHGVISKGKSITFNGYSHGIIKNNIRDFPNIVLNNNSTLYSNHIDTDLNKIEINDYSFFNQTGSTK